MHKPLRLSILAAAALIAVAVTASTALAAVNVKKLPVADFDGASVTLSGGNFSGLGNIPAIGNLTATGTATYRCLNPQGNPSPGQQQVPAQEGNSGPVDLGNSDHNGRGTVENITATVTAPDPAPAPQDVSCGGVGSSADKWTVELVPGSLTATAAHFVITQNGSVIFCRNYTPSGPATGTPC
jgi:hypothetical protein